MATLFDPNHFLGGAVLVAAGSGRRMGAPVPKALMPLAGKPLFLYAAEMLARVAWIRHLVLVVPRGREQEARNLCAQHAPGFQSQSVISGGAQRQDSARLGLEQLPKECGLVLIHDAARPFASPGLVETLGQIAWATGAAIPGIPLADTLKRMDKNHRVLETLPREGVVAVQTPQVFKAEILRRAYACAEQSGTAATDDAGLVEAAGYPVTVVEGEAENRKLTTPQDIAWAEKKMGVRP